jgi:peptidoglycan hydrolase-like protein with peptidoglycan-binding domain
MERRLSIGSSGLDVSELQAALNFHIRRPAKPLNPDGKFGPLTDARVREFQRRASIGVDGIVGSETIKALYRSIIGVVEANLTPRKAPTYQTSSFGQAPVGGGQRSALLPGFPRLGQVGPIIPDFIPPSLRVPQIRAAASRGFELESKFFFNPLADRNDGEHPLRLTLTLKMPWPVFLPEPLDLDIETTSPGVGKFQLDGKIKVPYKLIDSGRVELKPYFFVGAGVNQDNFKELNAGAGGKLKLKLVEKIGSSGLSLGLEADGGGKYNWDKSTGESKVKGFFDGGFVLEGRF